MDKRKKTPKLGEMESNELKFAMNLLKDLAKDFAFSKQKKILEDIQRAVEKANEKERRLNAKCLRLQSEITANTSKIKAAIQLSEEDKNTIDTLKEELEKAWNIADELKVERCKNRDGDRLSESDKRSHKDSLYSSTFSLQRKGQDFEEAEKIWASEKKSLQNEAEIQRKTSESLRVEMKQLQQEINSINSILSQKNEEIKQLEKNLKVVEEINVNKELGKGDQAAILDEIEKSRLQIFELEEELTNKDRVIEELTKENELKSVKLEQLEKEILETRKDSLRSANIDVEKCSFDVKPNNKVKNGCENKNHRNLEKVVNELCIKENEMALKLKFLEFNLSEKTNLLSMIQNDNFILKTALYREKELCKAFSERCNTLKAEANKNMKTLKELENSMNKYVSVIGKLETNNCKLEKELTIVEHCNYPEKIKSLENNLAIVRKELEEKENYLKEINEEISKLRAETEEFSKHLIDTLKTIESVHISFDTLIETKSKFCDGKKPTNKENLKLLILNLKEKVKDLAESYEGIKMEKYKLYDEIESLKYQRHEVKEKESKWTETEYIYFDVQQNKNERSETFSDDQISNLNVTVLETELQYDETEKGIEKSNEETGFQKYESYLSFIKPERTSLGLEIDTFNSGSENKSPKTDFNTSSITLKEERKSLLRTVSLDTSIEKNFEDFKIREVDITLQKTKRATSIPDVVTSQDLSKYRNQLRTKQKKLNIMKKELESSSSNFGTNRAIYQDTRKRTVNGMSVKKNAI
ncbi:unnamed protein product [Larinioides sclopetarius]|uniref:Uncharacterized protein n=1 Tax=Larinioides sclopetarius TaxID=280406 RepID=A0AAV2BUK9_9ARAC